MNNTNTDKPKEISEEDKQKILEAIEAIQKQHDSASLANNISMSSDKLIDCRHEIVIQVVAKILEEDQTGMTIGAKEICQKNYHIPVPANRDYNEYTKGFFDFLENCMSTSATNLEEDTNG
jgi:hypothetical protein